MVTTPTLTLHEIEDKAAVRTARRNIVRGKRSMRCHTAWKMIPTYISTVHASLSLHVVLHTTVLLYTARNCHDEIVRQLPKATGIAGASRRDLGRIGLCRAGGKLSSDFVPAWRPRNCRWRCYNNDIVVVTATVVASCRLCIRVVCRNTPQLNSGSKMGSIRSSTKSDKAPSNI
jgi:hypothetical protein